jgi:hypothetical protein
MTIAVTKPKDNSAASTFSLIISSMNASQSRLKPNGTFKCRLPRTQRGKLGQSGTSSREKGVAARQLDFQNSLELFGVSTAPQRLCFLGTDNLHEDNRVTSSELRDYFRASRFGEIALTQPEGRKRHIQFKSICGAQHDSVAGDAAGRL